MTRSHPDLGVDDPHQATLLAQSLPQNIIKGRPYPLTVYLLTEETEQSLLYEEAEALLGVDLQ